MKQSAIIIVAMTSTLALADNNPGSTPAPVPGATAEIKYPWESSVSAGLTLTRGNSDTTLFTADFLTQKKTPDNEYSLGASGAYGDQNSSDTVNNYKAFGQWNHLFTSQFYSYVRAEALRDVIANVDYRVTVGPGAGYYLIKETNTTFAVELGAAYVAQHLDGQSEQDYATVRLAERFEHKFSTKARVWENVEFLPQVDKFDNYVINAEIGAEAALTKSFSLKAFLDDSYQAQPAPGKMKNDAKLIAAVAYKF
jgi:putative salt-induced outer membrane protein YdiY